MPDSSFFVFADIMSVLCPYVNWLEINLFRNQSKSRKYFQKSVTKANVFQPFALKINKNGLKKGHFLKTTLLKGKWSEEMNFQSLQAWSLAEGKFFLLDRLLLLSPVTVKLFHSWSCLELSFMNHVEFKEQSHEG